MIFIWKQSRSFTNKEWDFVIEDILPEFVEFCLMFQGISIIGAFSCISDKHIDLALLFKNQRWMWTGKCSLRSIKPDGAKVYAFLSVVEKYVPGVVKLTIYDLEPELVTEGINQDSFDYLQLEEP